MKETFTNLKNVWDGLPKPRQIMLASVAGIILIVLVGVIFFANRPNMAVLVSTMPPEEVGRVVDFLKEKKVRYELVDGGKRVKVPESQVDELRLQLVQAGIPSVSSTAGGVGFELFDKPTFGMSDFMQKKNFYRALEGELARTIKEFDNIEKARVNIVVPDERLFDRQRAQAKASVLVQLKPGRELSAMEIKSIRALVANAVEGLVPGRVALADTSGKSLADDDASNGMGAISNSQLASRRQVEDHLRDKAQNMLDQALGYGQAVVQVTAELDFDSVSETAEIYDPKSQVVRNETIINENTNSKTEALTGVAGAVPNTEQRNSSDPGASTSTNQTRENITNAFDINRKVQTRQKAGNNIKRLTVAVFVNVRKTGTGATSNVQVRTPQEITELEKMVKAAVGYTESSERMDKVEVQEMPMVGLFDKDPVVAEAKTLGVPNKWLPWMSQGFLVLLAVGLLLYLRSILKSSTESDADAAGEFASLLGRYKKMADDAMAEANRDKNPPPFLTAEELSKLIRDNPSNTSQAIRVWLSRN